MKFQFFVSTLAFCVLSTVASAQGRPSGIDRLEREIDRLERVVDRLVDKLEDNGQQPGHGPRVDRPSSVDVPCIEQIYRTIPGTFSFDQFISVAQSCRTFNPAQRQDCVVKSQTPNDACFNAGNRMTSGSLSAEQALRLRTSCATLTYSCRF